MTVTDIPADLPVTQLDPHAIKVDAATYQFRLSADAKSGVTKQHCYIDTQWNPQKHGNPLLLHERLDGTLYVADGHHRLDLAKRLNAQGQEPKTVNAYILREAEGYTAKDVRLIAAYRNMAHDHTSMVESARIIKEARATPGVHARWLSFMQMDKSKLALSYTLSGLSDHALDTIEQAALLPQTAASVATSFADKFVQDGVLDIIATGKRLSGYADRITQGRAALAGLQL